MDTFCVCARMQSPKEWCRLWWPSLLLISFVEIRSRRGLFCARWLCGKLHSQPGPLVFPFSAATWMVKKRCSNKIISFLLRKIKKVSGFMIWQAEITVFENLRVWHSTIMISQFPHTLESTVRIVIINKNRFLNPFWLRKI